MTRALQPQRPVLHLEKVRVARGTEEVLDLDSFTLHEGESCVLMGPNGAGKTTLLRVILGIERRTQGEVQLFGQSLSHVDGKALSQLRCQIGYVPQQSLLVGEFPLTVREAISTGRTATAQGRFGRLTRQDWDRVEHWMSELGIAPLAQRCLNEISGGEQRKVMIARAMVQEPRLLLLDEPTANLDMGWREQIIQTLQDLYQRTSMAFILVCHELETVPACFQRVVLLNHGKRETEGTLQEVFTPERIEMLYGCKMKVVNEGGRYFALPELNPASPQ